MASSTQSIYILNTGITLNNAAIQFNGGGSKIFPDGNNLTLYSSKTYIKGGLYADGIYLKNGQNEEYTLISCTDIGEILFPKLYPFGEVKIQNAKPLKGRDGTTIFTESNFFAPRLQTDKLEITNGVPIIGINGNALIMDGIFRCSQIHMGSVYIKEDPEKPGNLKFGRI